VAPVELGGSSLESLLLLRKVTRMRSPLGWVVQPRMNLLAESLEHLQAALLLFLLQMPNWEGKYQCSSSRKTVEVIPADGALAGAGSEGCWALV
jgi:hypothetical protein